MARKRPLSSCLLGCGQCRSLFSLGLEFGVGTQPVSDFVEFFVTHTVVDHLNFSDLCRNNLGYYSVSQVILNKSMHYYHAINGIWMFLEGFLTTCSFDFLTDDDDTRVFVVCIFVWSYCIPMVLIIYFYSQLLKSVRQHEKMLRDQVSYAKLGT